MQLMQMLLGGRSFTLTGRKDADSWLPCCDFLNSTIRRLFSHSSSVQPFAMASRSPLIFSWALVGYSAYGLYGLLTAALLGLCCRVLVRTSCGAPFGCERCERLGR